MAKQRSIAFLVCCFGSSVLAAHAQQVWTKRVSVDSASTQSNYDSGHASLSADGRMIAFQSTATNLIANDTNGFDDVFVHDIETGITVRASVGAGGAQSDSSSRLPRMSGDGRWVGFDSEATNLVVGDTNGVTDVFVHELSNGATTRVSTGLGAAQANDSSRYCVLSHDGRWIAFESLASNLVLGDTNGALDVFVVDRPSGTTERASVASSGAEGNGLSHLAALSSNGLVLAFRSAATNFIPNDTNGCADIFVHDRTSGATTRINVTSSGGESNWMATTPSLSADGRWVAFESQATNLVPGDTNGSRDVFVHDRATGVTERVSVNSAGEEGAGVGSSLPILSADGRYVAFHSYALNLVPDDLNDNADIFLRDRWLGLTMRVSIASDGAEVHGYSQFSAVSADARRIAFHSDATTLVAGDDNDAYDVFVRDIGARMPTNFCIAGTSSSGCAATLSSTGTPSASGAKPFSVRADFAEGGRAGLFFFGLDNESFSPHP